MMKITVASLPKDEVPAAAVLLADRQRRFRDIWPDAAASFEDPARCLPLLEALFGEGDAFGAWNGSDLVGFVIGSNTERWGVIPAGGHAVAGGGIDAAEVYGFLYSELVERWVRGGVLVHDVELPAVPDIEDAWNDLGFGRRVCIASRSTGRLPNDPDPERDDLMLRLADDGDLASIARLAAMEVEFRAGPPMYLEGGLPDLDQLRETHAELFRTGAIHFVAEIENDIVGVLTLLRESRFEPICAERAPFVSTTVTDPRHRRRRIGRMLVRIAADWARERGHRQMDVSFQVASPLLRSFWSKSGFGPIGWKVARRLPASLLGADVSGNLVEGEVA
jgi:GNAT superfamily N-acetyltransferase